MFQDEPDGYFDVAAVAQVPAGGFLAVEAEGTELLLSRQGDAIVAVGGRCTHAFASLSDGRLDGDVVVCARHGARFDLKTGRALGSGCPNLPLYTVRIEAGRVLVRLE